MAAQRSAATGFAIPCPAMSGAEPWTGSKSACPSPRFALGRRPSPPTWNAATSERMSPNMFSTRITS